MGKTTLPARRTGAVPKAGLRPAVRWLFPALDGRLTWLNPGATMIGRDSTCDVQLDGPEMSRRHAGLVREGGRLTVRDLGSRNGVFVDRRKVTEVEVTAGSLLRLGDWIGLVVEADPAAVETGETFRELFPGLWAGPVLIPLLEPLRQAARTDVPVVIEGQTGSGKEGVARAIHAWSGRTGPFVALNCAAIPEALAEGELFGYRKGAFTGADRANPGYLRSAHEGTLLLDEIIDLPPALQPKLLRVLEQREVVPLGESRPVPVDVRMVAAAQAPLRDAVTAGKFRGDLFARLDGLALRLPPLRERVEEIPFLFTKLLARHAQGPIPTVSTSVIEQLCLHDWPFNVRELELLARRLLAVHGAEPTLTSAMLPERFNQPGKGSTEPPRRYRRREMPDPAAFLEVFRAHGGNVAHVATALGVSRQKVYRLLDSVPEAEIERIRSGGGDPQT
jgi:transcriptional regulator with AAA-type ATPase domain